MSSTDRSRRNVRIAVACAVVFVAMVGAAFAAVPAYKAFCQLTGFDGATRRAETAASQVLDKTVVVRFDANVRDVPWKFTAEQTSQTVKIGETKIAFFKVTNTSDKPITARATYNVVPEQAGAYFQKLQCFCFDEQVIRPGETRAFPVQYFVAPEIATDREANGVREITLSYTFYPSKDFDAASGSAPTGAAR